MSYINSMMKIVNSIYHRLFPREMVSWWMSKEFVQAKVTEAPDGSFQMWMKGEKYPFPGYPRGHLLYGSLSPLKHNIKVKIFNDSWWRLEKGESEADIVRDIKGPVLDEILAIGEKAKYDMMPIEKNVPSVREIHRAWTVATKDERLLKLRDIICFIFNEDDAYRMRFQWVAPYLKKLGLEKGMDMLEHAEIINDMKERVRLFKRILKVITNQDPTFWDTFIKELNIKKVGLTKADKFYFRAKYFKVDYPYYEY